MDLTPPPLSAISFTVKETSLWKKWFVAIFNAFASRPKYNYFYNGSWLVDQVNEGAAYTVTGGGGDSGIIRCMDGFSGRAVGAGSFTVQRVTDPDNAAGNACKIVCTVNDASLAAGDLYYVEIPLEGARVANLKSGTSAAKSITIKFNASFVITGTYGICVANGGETRLYAGTIVITSTAETSYTITLQLDTSGTWLYASATIGLRVRLTLAAGSSFQGSAGVWGTAQTFTTSAQANFMATATTNIIYLKQMQLVEGTVAGDIMPQSYAEALRDCQRFLRKSFPQGFIVASNQGLTQGSLRYIVNKAGAIVNNFSDTRFPIEMASTPVMTFYNPAAANAFARDVDAVADCTTTAAGVSPTGFALSATGVAGTAIGNRFFVEYLADSRL